MVYKERPERVLSSHLGLILRLWASRKCKLRQKYMLLSGALSSLLSTEPLSKDWEMDSFQAFYKM